MAVYNPFPRFKSAVILYCTIKKSIMHKHCCKKISVLEVYAKECSIRNCIAYFLLLKFPFSVIKWTNLSSLQPTGDAMKVECMLGGGKKKKKKKKSYIKITIKKLCTQNTHIQKAVGAQYKTQKRTWHP